MHLTSSRPRQVYVNARFPELILDLFDNSHWWTSWRLLKSRSLGKGAWKILGRSTWGLAWVWFVSATSVGAANVVPVAFVVVVASVGLAIGGCVATAVMSLPTKNTLRLIRRSPRRTQRRRTMGKACTSTPTETCTLASGEEARGMATVNL